MLFRNIGKKIKLLVEVIFWVGVAASTIAAIVYFVLALLPQYLPLSQGFATAGIIWLIGGPIAMWLSCVILYAFGELVDNTSEIKDRLSKMQENDFR